ncbi:GtrA family protein [Noviherbaspirillum soli]|uniref:GtrA family protein n=1 Tax=Noviherbaspirillum soli TaxID=1064518 RepID=UPI00188B7C7C|nr:GtrA family protein [Noviherbaspirillum soli]
MLNRRTLRQFWRFGIAGGIGFVVDVLVLYIAVALGSGVYLGRVMSFFCATFATWQVNRNFAFATATTMSAWAEWWRYVLAVLGGGLVNYLLFSLAVATLRPSPLLPMISVAIGSIGGMVVNFISTKVLVFRQ